MIPAKKSAAFNAVFAWHVRRRIARAFAELRARGVEETKRLAANEPLVIVSNHTAWWDPLLAIHACNDLLGADAYAMMDAKNLRALPFFARVGAFGVDLDDPRDGARAMRYAARLLDRPRRIVWIFAQGRERPVTERPLAMRAGSAEIARLARARVVPVALRYEMGSMERPFAHVAFGGVVERDRDVARGRATHETAVTCELDAIDRALCSGDDTAWDVTMRARSGFFARVAERTLAWLAR